MSVTRDRRNDAGRKVKSGAYEVEVTAADDGGAVASSTAGFRVVDVARQRR